MDEPKAETLYLSGRVTDSLAMAVAAAGPCAKIAHLTLARLYGEAIDALVARPCRPSLHSLLSNAGTFPAQCGGAVMKRGRPEALLVMVPPITAADAFPAIPNKKIQTDPRQA